MTLEEAIKVVVYDKASGKKCPLVYTLRPTVDKYPDTYDGVDKWFKDLLKMKYAGILDFQESMNFGKDYFGREKMVHQWTTGWKQKFDRVRPMPPMKEIIFPDQQT